MLYQQVIIVEPVRQFSGLVMLQMLLQISDSTRKTVSGQIYLNTRYWEERQYSATRSRSADTFAALHSWFQSGAVYCGNIHRHLSPYPLIVYLALNICMYCQFNIPCN